MEENKELSALVEAVERTEYSGLKFISTRVENARAALDYIAELEQTSRAQRTNLSECKFDAPVAADTEQATPRDMAQAMEWIVGLRNRVDSLLDIINAPLATPADAPTQQAKACPMGCTGPETGGSGCMAVTGDCAMDATPGAPVTATEEFLKAARTAMVSLAHAAEKYGIYQTDYERFAAAVEKFAGQSPAPVTAEPVAYLHQVVCGDGEPDQALSFAPDNFPLAGTLGYRSLSHQPLYTHPAPADRDAIRNEAQAERPSEWTKVTGPGQVKVGDSLRFTIGDKSYSERAKLILHAGTDKEEVIYNRKRNFYFITAMVLSGFSNHKNVEFKSMVRAADAAETRDVKGGA